MLYAPLLFLIWSLAEFGTVQGGSSQCTSGDIVCCDLVQSVNRFTPSVRTLNPTTLDHALLQAYDVPSIPSLTGMSNADAANLGLVGSACTTLTVIGLGKSCATKQQPVCCVDNNYNGVVSLGCAYINPLSA